MIFPSRSVMTQAMRSSDSTPLPIPRTTQPPVTTTWSPTGCVPGVAAALDERAREREELDVGVVQLEQRFDVAPPDRLEGELHDLHVLLRHCLAVSRRAQTRATRGAPLEGRSAAADGEERLMAQTD